MNKYKKYCCGSMGLFSTHNPLFVGWGKTHVGRGEFWENEAFVDAWDIPEINICDSNVMNHGGYIEVYPLYPYTYATPSINQITYGVVTAENSKKSKMETAGFWPIHSDGGYSEFRVPSLTLTRKQSKILMEGIMAEIESNEDEAKEQFSFFKCYLNLISSDNNITILDCGKKLQEIREEDLINSDTHFEFVLQFADQEVKLTYNNEQSRLLIECLK